MTITEIRAITSLRSVAFLIPVNIRQTAIIYRNHPSPPRVPIGSPVGRGAANFRGAVPIYSKTRRRSCVTHGAASDRQRDWSTFMAAEYLLPLVRLPRCSRASREGRCRVSCRSPSAAAFYPRLRYRPLDGGSYRFSGGSGAGTGFGSSSFARMPRSWPIRGLSG
jgi:hypothetical protein